MDHVYLPQSKRIRVTVESENHTSLAADLWKKRPDFTDVVFVVGGKEFPAHKMVLASKSEYFKSMLYGRMREASQKKIPLFFHDNIVTPATFEKVLKFAYTESLEVCAPLHDLLGIMYAADHVGFTELKAKLGEHLTNNINIYTVIQLYAFSQENELLMEYHMGKKCLEFIEDPKNTSTILKSEEFLELPKEHLQELISRDTFVAPEGDILQAVLEWKEHNDEEDMEDIVQNIRLSRFTAMEIFTIVEPTGLFTEADILDGVRLINTANVSESQPRGSCWPNTNLLGEVKDIEFSSYSGGQVTIELPKNYLINFLCFEIHPDLPAPDKLKGYSYQIKVFLDGKTELQLFNYFGDQCRGQQVLFFPTIPLRRVYIIINSIQGIQRNSRSSYSYGRSNRDEDETKLTSHQVSTLKFSNKKDEFKFVKGLIAPMVDYEVLFTQFSKKENNKQSAEAFINQPYSASTVTIEVTYDDTDVSFANIEVLIALTQNSETKITETEIQDIRSPIEVHFEEMLIGYVKVTITPMNQQLKAAHKERVKITRIRCKSSATLDDVDMEQWGPYIRAS